MLRNINDYLDISRMLKPPHTPLKHRCNGKIEDEFGLIVNSNDTLVLKSILGSDIWIRATDISSENVLGIVEKGCRHSNLRIGMKVKFMIMHIHTAYQFQSFH